MIVQVCALGHCLQEYAQAGGLASQAIEQGRGISLASGLRGRRICQSRKKKSPDNGQSQREVKCRS
jgi:hypothetical protein